MRFINDNILSIVLFLPLVGAILLAFLPRRDRDLRYFALAVSLLTLLASLHLPWYFARGQAGFQFDEDAQWIAHPNIHYHLGIDGISLWLVVLTTFLMPLCVLISWKSIHDRVKEFFVLMLVLETAMIGVFMALDLFMFYFFWEATLIPMALLIGMYGHGRKIYAAVKFFLYTMIASVFMLAAILWLYAKTGSFDFVTIQNAIQGGQVAGFSNAALWLFLGFFVAFAVKVPMFPVHTWLPDAHVEAPTAGSVLLAGVLLKMGTYGMLRFNLGFFPEEARRNAPWIMTLAIIGIVYGALVAMVQPNIKRLVAYTSVSHLGFVVLGIFSFTQMGVDGAVYQMLNHGVSTGALFMLLGMIYDRKHTYELSEYGGLATPMPVYATFFAFIMLSSVGLPLMNGFIGEFMILSGAFQAKQLYGILAATGVIWSACYLLWMYQRVFYGEVTNPANKTLPDIDARERVSLWPLVIAALVMGVAPMLWLHSISPSVTQTLKAFNGGTQAHDFRPEPRLKPPSSDPRVTSLKAGASTADEGSALDQGSVAVEGDGFSRAEADTNSGRANLQVRVTPPREVGPSGPKVPGTTATSDVRRRLKPATMSAAGREPEGSLYPNRNGPRLKPLSSEPRVTGLKAGTSTARLKPPRISDARRGPEGPLYPKVVATAEAGQ